MDQTLRRSLTSDDFALAGPQTIGGRFLRRFWQPVYLSERLANGEAVPILIMGEHFTLYRGETGVAHVVGHRCAHRSTQLSTGWVVGDAIRCLYHGWTYDGAGACIERPGETPSGPCATVSIPAYPTREHLGLVYAYFGPDTPPAFPPFPAFAEGGILETAVHEFPCNWFQTYENHADEAHLAFVHSTGGSHRALGREVELPQMSAEETDYGMVRLTRTSNRGLRSTLLIFPNTMRIIIPPFSGYGTVGGWRDSYLTVVPTDDATHLLFLTQQAHVPPEEQDIYWDTRRRYEADIEAARPIAEITADILAGKLKLADMRAHPLFLLIEDAVAQRGQGPIVDRAQETLGATDVCIVRLRRLFERELTALTEGGPMKPWQYDGTPPERGF
jgi:5,5'-dehydrodivanillate O-demethylase